MDARVSDRRRLAVLPFLAFEAPYFIFFLKYLLASSLSALPAVKRGLSWRFRWSALFVRVAMCHELIELGAALRRPKALRGT